MLPLNILFAMKEILIGAIALIVVGAGAFFLLSDQAEAPTADTVPVVTPTESDSEADTARDTTEPILDESEAPVARATEEVIGTSVNGAPITAYHYGSGDSEVLIVGGVHSAFAPNTVSLANELRDYFAENEATIPENVSVTVIPNLNPDASGQPNTLTGRLNANDVDLNRNFDCDWEAEGVWRSTPVSGGSAAFSEPEAAAVRDYVAERDIAAAVVYYAADGGVYASNCGGGIDSTITSLTSTYASAAGYTANQEFDAYKVSGDMTNWLAKEGVAAIGVLLSNYTGAEWNQNLAGVEAVLQAVAN